MSWRDLLVPTLVGTLRSGAYGPTALRQDLFGGLTAAVIALPLALAFGVASGAGPIAGLYGAIATGFFASLFGGTPAQVTGPTGPMTVVMGAVIASHADSLPEAFTIVMLGGVIQIGFGALGVGKYVAYTPYSVVSGFMTGIGVIILIIQTLPFLGQPSASGVPATLETLFGLDLGEVDWGTAAFSLAALLAIVYWPARLGRIVPAPLGVLALATVLAAFVFSGLPTIGAVPGGLPELVRPALRLPELPGVLQAAFILALLGSIDTLLTSLVADSITKTQHAADKELVGQGIGNVFAGLLGALPGAGATMRTVVNVRAGGRTPVSGIVHALVLLSLALGLGPLVGRVPNAALAAILMKVGWDIIDWGYLKRARRAPREKFAIMIVTFVLTVFVDLIMAVAVGIILASFVNSRWLAEEQLRGIRQWSGTDDQDDLTPPERELLRGTNGGVLVTSLHGSFSYASARELARRGATNLSDQHVVVYDFSRANYIDTSAALAIDEMIELSQQAGRRVVVAGLSGQALATLDGMGVLERVDATCRFDDRLTAIEAAAALCQAAAAPQI